MRRALRSAGWVLIGLVGAVVLLTALFFFLTRTQAGVERIRGLAVAQLDQRIEGELRIGRIEPGRLLAGVAIHDVSIADTLGRPFLHVDSARLSYHWRSLLAGDIAFSRITLYGPVVNFEQLPGQEDWNFQRIFPDTVPPAERRLILFENARIIDGTVLVRTPFEPEPPVEPGDTGRLILESAPGGLVRVLRFEQVQAELPEIIWESPEEVGQMIRVASLSTVGYIWEDPFQLRELRGAVTVRDSVISFDLPRAILGDSRTSAVGQVVMGDERLGLDIRIAGETVALRDLRWLYPPLPEEGGGSLTLHIQTQPVGTLWLAEDARLRAPGTELAGSFGVVTGDTLYFTNVSLRASPLNLQLLEDLLPVELPVDGLLVGTVIVEGPLSSLFSSGNVTLAATLPAAGSSAVRWQARLDLSSLLRGGTDVEILGFDGSVDRLDLALVSALADLPGLAGSASGTVRASGRLHGEIRFTASGLHSQPGHSASRFRADGSWTRSAAPAGTPRAPDRFDVLVNVLPLGLDVIAAAFPQLEKLHGEVTGPVRLAGSAADLLVQAALQTPAGPVELHGRFDLAAAVPRYQLEGSVSNFRIDELVAELPETEVSGQFRLEGAGFELGEARARLQLDLTGGRIRDLRLSEATVELGIADGLARLDSLVATGPGARLEARGSFGLLDDRMAALRFNFASDSVAAVLGAVLPELAPDNDTAAAHFGGELRVAGTLTGNLAGFDVEGDGTGRGLWWEPLTADSVAFRFDARRIRTDDLSLQLTVTAERVAVYDRLLETAQLALDYQPGGEPGPETALPGPLLGTGDIWFSALAPADESYRLASGFRRIGEDIEFDLRDVLLDIGTAAWSLAAPTRVRVAPDHVLVDGVNLVRLEGNGGIYAFGTLPVRSSPDQARPGMPIDFSFDVDGLRLAEILRVVRPGLDGDGLLAGGFRIQGSPANPMLTANFAITDFRHEDVRLERIDGEVGYDNRELQLHIDAQRDGRRVLRGVGRIPVDLAVEASQRRLDEPLTLTLAVDSLPAVLVTSLLEDFSRVEGYLEGAVEVSGTTLHPLMGGTVQLRRGAATWAPAGVRYRDVEGTFRFVGNRVIAVDATARADVGRAGVTGTINLEEALDNPRFDLLVRATEFQAARRRDVEAVTSGEVRLRGTYRAPRVELGLRVERGTMNLDELLRQYLIVELDMPFLTGLESSSPGTHNILPTNDFLRNLVVEGNVVVGRDSWLRSREMNVEVAGQVALVFDRAREDLRMTGSLQVVRGTYQVAGSGRRFTVRQGSVDFVGTPGLDPNLNIVAVYRARMAHGDPLDIQALVTGTLQAPRFALSSDVQPPISESDLISYLFFGVPTYALGGAESRALDLISGLGAGFVGPAFWGYAATGLETVAQNFGLDYVAITAAEMEASGDGSSRLGGLFAGTQLEVGRYLPEISPNLFLALTQRIGAGGRGAGARLEWRLRPTWTAELFVEDRFARTPSFGLDQSLELRKIYGFSLFREWGFRDWWPGREDSPAAPDPAGNTSVDIRTDSVNAVADSTARRP